MPLPPLSFSFSFPSVCFLSFGHTFLFLSPCLFVNVTHGSDGWPSWVECQIANGFESVCQFKVAVFGFVKDLLSFSCYPFTFCLLADTVTLLSIRQQSLQRHWDRNSSALDQTLRRVRRDIGFSTTTSPGMCACPPGPAGKWQLPAGLLPPTTTPHNLIFDYPQPTLHLAHSLFVQWFAVNRKSSSSHSAQ